MSEDQSTKQEEGTTVGLGARLELAKQLRASMLEADAKRATELYKRLKGAHKRWLDEVSK